MTRYTRAGLLKRIILLFWSVWITTVVLMNVGDALKVVGVLPSDWKLASGNYQAIVDAAAVYGTPHWLDFLLFFGSILWESAAVLLFWMATRRYRRRWLPPRAGHVPGVHRPVRPVHPGGRILP